MSTITKYEFSLKVLAIHQLRVNVKSLASEARLIRQEERRCGSIYVAHLQQHRRVTVREESRYAQLALAFVRGRAYKAVEQGAKEKPSAQRLHAKLSRFVNVKLAEIEAWLK